MYLSLPPPIATREQDSPAADDDEPDTPAPAAGTRDLDVTLSPASENTAAGDDAAGVAGPASPGVPGLVLTGLGVLVGMAVVV